jgi:Transglycosylase SLT domain
METQVSDKGPSDGPWNMSAKSLAVAAGNLVEGAVEAVKSTKKPWEMGWKELASTRQDTPIPATSSAPLYDFDTVFSKLIGAESKGVHTTASGSLLTSPKGAQGITQVMPKTGATPGYGVTPLQNNSEEEYRRFGKDYLKAMLKEFGGDYEKALAAYNAGAGNVKAAITKATRDSGDWKSYLPNQAETLPYVKQILAKGK